MNQKQMFALDEGLVFLAFAYTTDAYQTASLFAAVCAVVLAVYVFSWKRLMHCLKAAVLITAVCLSAVVFTDLPQIMPMLVPCIFANALTAMMWRKADPEEISTTMKILMGFMAVFYFLSAFLPETRYGFTDSLLITCIAFLPMVCSYGSMLLHAHRRRVENRRKAC
jgi:hypothetical protein